MFNRALSEIPTCEIKPNEPMKKHTSLGVGGIADYYAEADSLCALNQLIQRAKEHKIKYKILGFGTNVLVSDKGYRAYHIYAKTMRRVF